MYTFFHGWRRKAGVVTLIIALGIMACWARSYAVRDVVTTAPLFEQGHRVSSEVGTLEWVSWKANSPRPLFPAGWRSQRISYTKLGRTPLIRRVKFQLVTASLAGANAEGFAIPHWLLAIPPTLLSTCLLLWKPRKAKSSDQISNIDSNSPTTGHPPNS